MTLKQLEYALAIAKYGSLSQAAENLYISQPTLSETIKNLEDELGFPLFVRRHSGMFLTSEGESFITDAQTVVEQMSYLESQYTAHREKKQHFSVSSTHFYFTESAFTRLAQTLDGRYMLRHLDSRKLDVLNEVSSGISEIGVCSYTEETRVHTLRKLKSCHLGYEVLRTLRPSAFFSSKHPLANRKSLKLEDLKPYPCSTFYQGTASSRYFEEEMCRLPEWDKELVLQDNGAITFFMLGTDCFSIGSGVVPKSIQPLGICAIPITDVPSSTIIWIKRQNHVLSDLAKQFISLCDEELLKGAPAQFL